MPTTDKAESERSIIKVVYFDEESASDYLDISAGGKAMSTSEQVKNRTTDLHARVESKLTAKLSWLPFIGATAEAGAGVNATGGTHVHSVTTGRRSRPGYA